MPPHLYCHLGQLFVFEIKEVFKWVLANLVAQKSHYQCNWQLTHWHMVSVLLSLSALLLKIQTSGQLLPDANAMGLSVVLEQDGHVIVCSSYILTACSTVLSKENS